MESSIVAASALLAWKVTQRARLLTKADKRGACAAWIGYFDNDINFQHCDVRRLRVQANRLREQKILLLYNEELILEDAEKRRQATVGNSSTGAN